MRAIWFVFRLILSERRVALLRGAALGALVLALGAALLGLSGWFVTAAAAAGLAGSGAVFDVFRPSAMVRFLALGRAAARYGERLLTHDATLRALETLRLRVLGSYLTAPYPRMIRIRGAQAVNRLMADIDALDGVPLRLVLPVAAGLAVQALAFAVIWALAGLALALWIALGWSLGAALVFGLSLRGATGLSRRAEAAAQAVRSRLIDLIRARRDLAVYGRLTLQKAHVEAAEVRRVALRRDLDRIERQSGAAFAALGALVGAGALAIGLVLAQAGALSPALAAMGFLAALALAETVMPLRRAAADFGRMAEAARRLRRDLARPAEAMGHATATGRQGLAIRNLVLDRPAGGLRLVMGLSIEVQPGEMVALTGASGSGKSTLLLAAAGLHPVAGGEILVGGLRVGDWDEAALRAVLTLVPQRSALLSGTVAEALRLAAPGADDTALWQALKATRLGHVLERRGGLEMRLGPRGEGLSGGEARRLVLARAILRRPSVLLLDEATEGLDEATAGRVLQGIRNYLPEAAILIASHRGAETALADRVVAL
jgi:ATP-binding cassette subfamily C protein CydC